MPRLAEPANDQLAATFEDQADRLFELRAEAVGQRIERAGLVVQHFAAEIGHIRHPRSPSEGAATRASLTSPLGIASVAKQSSFSGSLDCFVAALLAMTACWECSWPRI
jgi:hypothetical protein